MAAVTNQNYIAQLTGIRIFAVIWIFLYHTSFVFGFQTRFSLSIQWGWFREVIARGAYGVEIFFISSGFVISYVYMRKFYKGLFFEGVRKFYLFRLSKIYPLYVVTLFLTWVFYKLGILDNPMIHQTGSSFLNVALMQTWFLDVLISWNSPAWALSAEWFLYLLFPLFALMLSRIQKPWVLCFILIIVTYIYYIFLINTRPLALPFFTPPFIGTGSLIRAGFGFTLGIILFKFYEKKILGDFPGDFLFVAVCAGIVALLFWDIRRELEIISVTILLTILIYALIKSRHLVFYCFGNRVVVYLGKLSFAFYLIHYPAIRFIDYFYSKADITIQTPALHLLTMTTVLILFSAFFYHLIEVKCQKLVRRWSDKIFLREPQ